MSSVVLPFLAGITIGGLLAWALVLIAPAVNLGASATPTRKCWSVESITARIEREDLEANRTAYSATQPQPH
ncbi:hypothetical protein [Nocardia sp. SYP-A9097]|uniref:hypothetical protein n=1 Tax=Nocardia sp. SYP-A9097 TaxID=2663237 RepID=UPI00129A4CD6|nr:hypothetical protein [Nocardia sp. SYP-A9097]